MTKSGSTDLAEPIAIRPTSEIGMMFWLGKDWSDTLLRKALAAIDTANRRKSAKHGCLFTGSRSTEKMTPKCPLIVHLKHDQDVRAVTFNSCWVTKQPVSFVRIHMPSANQTDIIKTPHTVPLGSCVDSGFQICMIL